jgi:hypothetical protein
LITAALLDDPIRHRAGKYRLERDQSGDSQEEDRHKRAKRTTTGEDH